MGAWITQLIVSRKARECPPLLNQTLSLPELGAQVDVLRDDDGIPSIYARSLDDALVGQGFVHAQERLFQMDVLRRAAYGRLSEVFGQELLEVDKAARTFGWGLLADQDWEEAEDDIRLVIDSYATGVNAFMRIDPDHIAVEFKLAGYYPEQWRPQDSLAILRILSNQLGFGVFSKLVHAKLVEKVGEEYARDLALWPGPSSDSVCQPAASFKPSFDLKTVVGNLGGVENLTGGLGGSNAWAITGSRTTTGAPILAADPHLSLTTPGMFYLCHVHVWSVEVPGELDTNGRRRADRPVHCSGASVPGLPLVMVGHTRNVAWGLTTAFVDVEDVFIERFTSDITYEYNGADRQAHRVVEEINVLGRSKPVQHEILYTHHGPVISGIVTLAGEHLATAAPDEDGKVYVLSVMSQNRAPNSKSMRGVIGLSLAQSWSEFRDACRWISSPPLNIVYADTAGNIGCCLGGDVPLRKHVANFRGPVPGWIDEYEWAGVIPHAERPSTFNPPSGIIISCNQRLTDDSYPYALGYLFKPGDRAQRVAQLLDSKTRHSIADNMVYQNDFRSNTAIALIRSFGNIEISPRWNNELLNLLRVWDGTCGVGSVCATLYHVLVKHLVQLIIVPHIGPELLEYVLGRGWDPRLKSYSPYLGQASLILLRLFSIPDPDSTWWIGGIGGVRKVVHEAMEGTVAYLVKRFGTKDKDAWTWGRLHTLTLKHIAVGDKRSVASLFNTGPFAIGGSSDTIFMTALTPDDHWGTQIGPVYKQVIDLRALQKSKFICTPGQSGHLASPYYRNFLDRWRRGEYLPMRWTRAEIDAAAKHRLVMIALPNAITIGQFRVQRNAKGRAEYVEYQVLEHAYGDVVRSIWRRYSAFKALHVKVINMKTKVDVQLPPFPPATNLGRSFDRSHLDYRRQHLERYLRALSLSKRGEAKALLHAFMRETGEAPGSRYAIKEAPGLLVDVQPAGPDIQEIADKVRMEVEVKNGGVFKKWEAVSFATQMTGGVNYFIKVSVGSLRYVHLRVWARVNGRYQLTAVQLKKTESDPLEYFESRR